MTNARLTQKIQNELAARIRSATTQKDAAAAAWELVQAAKGLVISEAKRHRGHGIELEDLISEAKIAAYEAALAFDPERAQFSTFLRKFVTRALGKTIAKSGGPVSFGEKAWATAVNLHRETVSEAQEKHRTNAALVAEWGQALSFDQGFDGEAALTEVLADIRVHVECDVIEAIYRTQADAWMANAIAQLPAKQARIMRARWALDGTEYRTQQQLADEFSVNQTTINYHEKKAMETLRESAGALA